MRLMQHVQRDFAHLDLALLDLLTISKQGASQRDRCGRRGDPAPDGWSLAAALRRSITRPGRLADMPTEAVRVTADIETFDLKQKFDVHPSGKLPHQPLL